MKNFFFLFLLVFNPLCVNAQDLSNKGIPVEQIQQVLAYPDYSIEKRLTTNIKKRLRKNPEFITLYAQNTYFIFKTAFIHAVAELSEEKFYNYLLSYLDDKNEQIVASAINALGYTNNPDYIKNLAPLLIRYKNNELMVVRILSALGNSFSDNAVEYISRFLADRRINIALAAVISLCQLGSEKAVFHVIKEYRQPRLRQKIIYHLGRCTNCANALKFLEPFANNPDHPYFLEAIKSIGELESNENLNYLVKLLDKNNKPLSEIVLYAISRIGDIKSIPKIYAFLDTVKSRTLKETIFSSIATICQIYNKEEILNIISGSDHAALIAVELGKLGDASSIDVLFEVLEDDDPINKIFAIAALTHINDESIIPNLISRLSSSTPIETYYILNYLKKCYGKKLVTAEFIIEKISNISYRNDKLNIFYALLNYYDMEDGIISVMSNESNPYLWIMIDSVKSWQNCQSITHLLKYYLKKGSLTLRYYSAKTLINFAKDKPELKSFLHKCTAEEKNPIVKEILKRID